MKKLYSIYVIAAGAILMLVSLFVYRSQQESQQALLQTLKQYQDKFVQDEASVRLNASHDEAYVIGKRLLLKDYYDKLKKLADKDNSILDLDKLAKQFELADAQKPIKEEQKQLREEYIAYTKEVFNRLFTQQYAPIMTTSAAGVRFDIVQLKRVRVMQEEFLETHFIAWGLSDETSFGPIQMAIWANNKGQREIKYKFEASNARPILYVNHPDHLVRAFPSRIVFGYYRLQLVPQDAEKIDLSFVFQVAGGQDQQASRLEMAFKQLEANELWFMPAGQKFNPEKVEASDDERKGIK